MVSEEVYHELKAAIIHWPIWLMLASQDIKLRYNRTSFGPFWVTIRTSITIYTTGILYGHLFKTNLNEYFPYLATGLICWGLISSLLIESSCIYLESARYIKNQETFLSIFMIRLIMRNLIVFAHNLLAFLPIVIFYHLHFSWGFLLIFPGLIFLCLNAFIWGSAVALLGARYRDCMQITASMVQVVFFLTPVIWMPASLPDHYQWLINYNPVYQFMCLIRNPLLNLPITSESFYFVSLMTLSGLIFYTTLTRKYKHDVVFWI